MKLYRTIVVSIVLILAIVTTSALEPGPVVCPGPTSEPLSGYELQIKVMQFNQYQTPDSDTPYQVQPEDLELIPVVV